MTPQLIAHYIAHTVSDLLRHEDAAKPHTLYVWIKPDGLIEQSFDPNWPSKNGVKLIGANVFSVELGLDLTTDDAKEAIEERDGNKMTLVIRAQTLKKIYEKALTNLSQRKAPELLIKAAVCHLNALTRREEKIPQPEINHAFH